MKISFSMLFFLLFTINTIGQNKESALLRTSLTKTNIPLERFGILNKIYDHEYNNSLTHSKEITKLGVEMHRIAQKEQNDSLLAISYNIIGSIFRDKDDYPTALEYYFKGIPLAEKSKDKRRLSSLYFDVSGIYETLEDYEDNLKYIKKGGENLPDKSSPMYSFMVLQYYHIMANYFFNKKEPKKALVYVRNAENENATLMNDNYSLTIQQLYGRAYRQMGDNEMANAYYRKSLAIAESSKDPITIANVKFVRANYLVKTRQFDEIRKASQVMYKIAGREQLIYRQQMAAQILKEVYSKTHQIDSAFFYLQIESKLKDSLLNNEKRNKIQTMAFKAQMREIDEKVKQDLLEEERKRNIQYIFISLGIISLILVFILMSHSVIVNGRWISFFGILSLLLVFEFINLIIHPFLESITHHSPILMLFALVFLASILIPLHHKLEKWVKEKMIEKNKAIRLALAKKNNC